MKTAIFAASLSVAVAVGFAAQAQDLTAAAQQDLQAAHDLLRDNAPQMVVDRDSAGFRSWLDAGLAQAKALPTSKIANIRGYTYALRAYGVGFRDVNVDVRDVYAQAPEWFAIDWPGFALGWRAGAYVVEWTNPRDNHLPQVGAKLISCDRVPAETLAQKRLDLFEGDLRQPSDRLRTAPYLLWNRANPFVDPTPAKCDFDVGGRRRTYQINPQIGGEDLRRQAYEAGAGRHEALSLEPFAGGFWITVHTLDDSAGWDAFLAQIEAQQAAIQAAPVVVLDLRGAAGASSRNGFRVANRIWTPDVIAAGAAQTVHVAYRATGDNAKSVQTLADQLKASPQYAYQAPKYQALATALSQAVAAHQPTLQQDESVARAPGDHPNPVKGKVIVLTDGWCTAGCLDVLDVILHLPNVVQAGAATSTSSIFVAREELPLPSGQGKVVFGGGVWSDRGRGSDQPYAPAAAMTYNGAPDNETAYKAWVQGFAHP